MTIRDTSITDWSPTDGNSPSNNTAVDGDLGAQIRNIKSVYRTLSVNKLYEDPLLPTPLSTTADYGTSGTVLYLFSGNYISILQEGRKVIARRPSDGSLVGGAVTYSRVSANNSVVLIFYGDNWDVGYSQLLVGTSNVSPRSFPIDSFGGTFALRGADNSVTVNFGNVNSGLGGTETQIIQKSTFESTNTDVHNIGTTLMMPTKNYHVHIQPCYLSGLVSAGKMVALPAKITKDYTKFTVEFFTGPGTIETTKLEAIFDWFITIPEYN